MEYLQRNVIWLLLFGLLQIPVFATAAEAAAQVFVNSVGIEFVKIPLGSFLMGGQNSADASSKEKPQHQVTITRPFYLGKYELTQKQWLAVMGQPHPDNFPSSDRPVDEVSWNDVQAFLQRLNTLEPGAVYRLPTEAEWEYAARSGSETAYCFGDDPQGGRLAEYAWYEENADKQTHPVGSLQANAWGLHDMHGNVIEWVQDLYDKSYYVVSPEKDPRGPTAGKKRVVRGGSWIHQAWSCRSAYRGYFSADYTDSDFGFRIVKEVE